MIETPLRIRHEISEGWEFVRGWVGRRWMRGRKTGGEVVDLPHCWNRTDTYQYGRRSYSGRGGYRKEIVVPEVVVGDGQWHLRSEGFYGFGDLWIDGRAFARIDGRYLGFDAPLPDSTTAGTHLMTLRLDNFFRRRVLPGRSDPDFLLYGGLAGRVWLEWVPTLRIDRRSVEVVCSRGPENAEILDLRCSVRGRDDAPDDLRLNWTISTADGERIAAAGPAPVADDTSFELAENSADGTIVGNVLASDADGDPLGYSVIGGSGAAIFAVDSATGAITVTDETALDFEAYVTPVFTLEVQVDDGNGGVATATVTIHLLNQASISGDVFVDINENGLREANEPGIDGVTVELLDSNGQAVLDETPQQIRQQHPRLFRCHGRSQQLVTQVSRYCH